MPKSFEDGFREGLRSAFAKRAESYVLNVSSGSSGGGSIPRNARHLEIVLTGLFLGLITVPMFGALRGVLGVSWSVAGFGVILGLCILTVAALSE